MATYTNTLRFTGLSGMDTESMITQLMKSEGLPLNKLKKTNQLLAWTQEAYRAQAAALKSFQNTYFNLTTATNNMRLTGSFNSFTTNLTLVGGGMTTAAGVTPADTAKAGTYTLSVEQLAQKNVYKSTQTISNSVKFGQGFNPDSIRANHDLGDGTYSPMDFNVNLDGVTRTITFSSDEIADLDSGNFLSRLNTKLSSAFGSDAGTPKLSADWLDAGNPGAGFVFKPGAGHTFTIYEGAVNKTAIQGAGSLDLTPVLDAGRKISFDVQVGSAPAKTIEFTLTSDTKQNENLVAGINSELTKQGVALSAALKDGKLTFTSGDERQDIKVMNNSWGDAVGSVFGFTGDEINIRHTGDLADLGLTSGDSNAINNTRTLTQLFPDFNFDALADANGNISLSINNTNITFNKDDKLSYVMSRINNSGAGVTFTYDAGVSRFTLESKNLGAVNQIDLGASNSMANQLFGGVFKLSETQVAQDAKFKINDVETTRETNNFTMFGLSIQLNDKTEPGKDIVIELQPNTQGSIDKIKDFVNSYNKLIGDINAQISTTRPKSGKYSFYEPLTEDEKSAMSDREVGLWEEKAKTGLLNRDSILSGVVSQMRSILYEPVTLEDGSKISLYEIGITTSSDYRDKGMLVIDEAKLRNALESRPDAVASLFAKGSGIASTDKNRRAERLRDEGLSDRLNDIINDAIGSAGSISLKAGVVGGITENTNSLYLQMKDNTDRINDLLSYLTNKEEYYYQMFSKMETSLNANNSQMAYLQSLMGA